MDVMVELVEYCGRKVRGGRTPRGWRTGAGEDGGTEGMRGKETFRLRSGLERVGRK